MKRILAAAAVAILFHVALLKADMGWFFDQTTIPPRSTAVTVTMSYRKPAPEAVPEKKKRQVKQPEIKPKETVRLPNKQPEKPPPEAVAEIPVESRPPSSEAVTENREPEAAEDISSKEEDLFEDDQQGDAVSNMQVFQEAMPLYKNNPPPSYPRAARKRGWQGTVVLSVFVDENGQVENLWVLTSSGYNLLDNAAVNAVRNWVFEPGMKGNKKLSMWVKVPIRFQLK